MKTYIFEDQKTKQQFVMTISTGKDGKAKVEMKAYKPGAFPKLDAKMN